MFKCKYVSILLVVSSILTGSAIAEGIGGSVLPVAPDRFRTAFDGGVIFPQFALFKFGDIRNAFPISGGEVIKKVFHQRRYAPSYYAGAREAVKLPLKVFGGPLELNGRFGIYNVHHKYSFSEHEADPEIYVPYIDGVIRPDLTGGAVVGLFANSDLKLKRKQFSYEIEAGLRASYKHHGWSLIPGIFFTYQRMKQSDYLESSLNTDPTKMTLSAHVKSNHYNIAPNFRFTSSLSSIACWLGCVSVGAEYVNGHYNGRQTFAGTAFDESEEQLATVDNKRNRWGVSVATETGVCFFCNRRASLSILGNFRYINVLPYVKYPVPILNSQAVTGAARIKFQNQFTFGVIANLSIVF